MENALRDDGGDGFLRPVANERPVPTSAHTIAVAIAVAVAIYPGESLCDFDTNSVKKAPNCQVPGFERRKLKQQSHISIFPG
jgi:hypothetical protein